MNLVDLNENLDKWEVIEGLLERRCNRSVYGKLGTKNVECMWVLWTWRKHRIESIGRHYGKYREFMMWVVNC